LVLQDLVDSYEYISGGTSMKKIIIYISLISLIFLTISGIAFSWEITNHEKMSEKAVNISQLADYCENNLGFRFLFKQFHGLVHNERKWEIEEFAGDKNWTATDWIVHGSGAEDEYFEWWLHVPHYQNDMRSVNHFYNPFWDNEDIYPYYNEDWFVQQGGLYDEINIPIMIEYTLFYIPVFVHGKPLPRWGYDGCPDTPPNSDFTRSDNNYFSWKMARKYFYAAVSGDSTELDGISGIEGKINMSEKERDRCFALLFRSLGQLLHLVQDAGQPEHTRNDAHPLSGFIGFEGYAEDYNCTNPSCSSFISWQSIVKSDNSFIDFIDSNRSGGGYNPTGSTGIAEFSNYNFLTKDSIADNIIGPEPHGHERHRYFTSPVIDEAQVFKEKGFLYYTQYYLAGPISDPLGVYPSTQYKIAKRRWHYNLLRLYGKGDYTTEDPKIWDDYLDILIPRCIGYSAALLDYFFRGTIEISLPQTGVYVVKDPSDPLEQGFTRITLCAQNTSPEGEEMTDGSIELVVKYRLALADPFISYPDYVPYTEEFSYIVVPEASGIRSIPRESPVELDFDLSGNPIPLWATDLYLQVVYKGRLGGEENAVGLGFKDVSEPTPLDLFNNMDKICLYNTWYDAGSENAIGLVDADNNGIADPDEWDVYPKDMEDIYVRFSPVSNCQYATETEYSVYVPYLGAGDYIRIFLLSDYEFCLGLSEIPVAPTHPDDQFGYTFFPPGLVSISGIKHQTELELDPPHYIRYYPLITTFRGIDKWISWIFNHRPFPEDSSCSLDVLE
jgi:hypothetical protein